MTTIKRNPLDRVPVGAARVISDSMGSTSRFRLRRSLSIAAAIYLHEVVPKRMAELDGQHVIADSVLAEVSDWSITAIAAADFRTGEDGNGAEDIRSRTSNRVAHSSSPAPTRGEPTRLVDAERRFHGFEDLVGEGDILAVCVCPAVVQALGSYEDGRHFVGEVAQAVESTVNDIVHGAVTPMVPDHELVRRAGIIVLRGLDNVFPRLSVDIQRINTAIEAWICAASRRAGRGRG